MQKYWTSTETKDVELDLKMWYADAKSSFVCAEKEMVAMGSADVLVRI